MGIAAPATERQSPTRIVLFNSKLLPYRHNGEKARYAMEIIRTNVDPTNKKLLYKLTRSAGKMVQDTEDRKSIPVAAYALYNDPKENKDGTARDNLVLSFITPDGEKFSTVSATFQREFFDIVDLMQDEAFAVLLIHGTTKGGKPFVTCELDCDF